MENVLTSAMDGIASWSQGHMQASTPSCSRVRYVRDRLCTVAPRMRSGCLDGEQSGRIQSVRFEARPGEGRNFSTFNQTWGSVKGEFVNRKIVDISLKG